MSPKDRQGAYIGNVDRKIKVKKYEVPDQLEVRTEQGLSQSWVTR